MFERMQEVTLRQLIEGILHFLSVHPMLLILDNVDDIRAFKSRGALQWVFRGLGRSRCLITSRISAHIMGALLNDLSSGLCMEIRPEDNEAVMEAMVARYASHGKSHKFPADKEVPAHFRP
jgi:hypothetical protein